MRKKVRTIPSPKTFRWQLLGRIREASLPADADKFSQHELEAAGILKGYTQRGMDAKSFRLLVLFATQAKELHKECKHLRHELELHKDYHSPIWKEARQERCPIKQAELERKAREDDRLVNEQRRKERDPMVAIRRFSKLVGTRGNWAWRDRRGEWSPFVQPLWHQSMTIMDYHEATGLTRRTLKNMVDRLGLHPERSRKRRNEPERYGQAANAAVLNMWLMRHAKNVEDRRGMLARILIRYKFDVPEHHKWLMEALQPSIQSLRLSDADFSKYLADCERVLYPSVQSPAHYSELKNVNRTMATLFSDL